MVYLLFRVFKQENNFSIAGARLWHNDHFLEVPEGTELDFAAMSERFVTAERFLHSQDTRFPFVHIFQLSEEKGIDVETPVVIVFPEWLKDRVDFPVIEGYREQYYGDRFVTVQLRRDRAKGKAYYEKHYSITNATNYQVTTNRGLARGNWMLKPECAAVKQAIPLYCHAIDKIPYVCHHVKMDENGKAVVQQPCDGLLKFVDISRRSKEERTYKNPRNALNQWVQNRFNHIFHYMGLAHWYYKDSHPDNVVIQNESQTLDIIGFAQYAEGLAESWRGFAQLLGYTGVPPETEPADFYELYDVTCPAEFRGKGELAFDNDLVLDCLNSLANIANATREFRQTFNHYPHYLEMSYEQQKAANEYWLERRSYAIAMLLSTFELLVLLKFGMLLKWKEGRKGTSAFEWRGVFPHTNGGEELPENRTTFPVQRMISHEWPDLFVLRFKLPPNETIHIYKEIRPQPEIFVELEKINLPAYHQEPGSPWEGIFRSIIRSNKGNVFRPGVWLMGGGVGKSPDS